jgi:hypothetical protein
VIEAYKETEYGRMRGYAGLAINFYMTSSGVKHPIMKYKHFQLPPHNGALCPRINPTG